MTTIGGSTATQGLSLGRLQADMAGDAAGASRLNANKAADRAEIKKVADEFESLFLNMVLKSMRDTVQKSGLVDGGNAEEIYRSMLDDEYAKQMAAQRMTGIGGQIEDFMLRAKGLDKVEAAPKDGAASTLSAAVGGPAVAALQGLEAYQDAALQRGGKRETMVLGGSPRLKAP